MYHFLPLWGMADMFLLDFRCDFRCALQLLSRLLQRVGGVHGCTIILRHHRIIPYVACILQRKHIINPGVYNQKVPDPNPNRPEELQQNNRMSNSISLTAAYFFPKKNWSWTNLKTIRNTAEDKPPRQNSGVSGQLSITLYRSTPYTPNMSWWQRSFLPQHQALPLAWCSVSKWFIKRTIST